MQCFLQQKSINLIFKTVIDNTLIELNEEYKKVIALSEINLSAASFYEIVKYEILQDLLMKKSK